MATLTHLSQNSGSLPDGQSFVLMPESRVLEDPLSPGYSQPLHVSEPPQKPGVHAGTDAACEQSGLSGCPGGLSLGGRCLLCESMPGACICPGSALSLLIREESRPKTPLCVRIVGTDCKMANGSAQRSGNPKVKARGGWR